MVVGLSLFLVYGRGGWFGGWFAGHGIQILFALPAMVLATIFVSLPFVVREVVPVLREIGDEQEQAARTLGASGWQTFWRITLPSIRWAVTYGVVLTTARCARRVRRRRVVSGRHRRADRRRSPLVVAGRLRELRLRPAPTRPRWCWPLIAIGRRSIGDDRRSSAEGGS